MSGRSFALLAAGALAAAAAAACVEVPENMRAEFAGPGPADRTNYRPGAHGSARANWTRFKVSGDYDAGAPDASPAADAPAASAPDAAAPLESDAGGATTAFDGGNT